MRTRILAAAAAAVAAFAVLPPAPASGVGIGFGMSGTINVGNDFGACATITSTGGPFTGTFVAVGEMQGPGTRIGTVRAVLPVSGTYYWHDCVAGAYDGATAGEAKYLLHAHSTMGDFVEVKHCVVNRGAVSCV